MSKVTKLHEILAVEKTLSDQSSVLIEDAKKKFQKGEYFQGHNKVLKMIADTPENKALEASSTDVKELPTTVIETLEYALQHWANAEDIILQKNATNQSAVADLEFNGEVIATNVPVDELLGLEKRLADLRTAFQMIPTLNASVKWQLDTASDKKGTWTATHDEVTTKTEKRVTPVVLYEATDKHPAQVKEVSSDITVGTFVKKQVSGAATSLQKAEAIKVIESLIAEVKKARMRANTTEVKKVNIGKTLTDLILQPLLK